MSQNKPTTFFGFILQLLRWVIILLVISLAYGVWRANEAGAASVRQVIDSGEGIFVSGFGRCVYISNTSSLPLSMDLSTPQNFDRSMTSAKLREAEITPCCTPIKVQLCGELVDLEFAIAGRERSTGNEAGTVITFICEGENNWVPRSQFGACRP